MRGPHLPALWESVRLFTMKRHKQKRVVSTSSKQRKVYDLTIHGHELCCAFAIRRQEERDLEAAVKQLPRALSSIMKLAGSNDEMRMPHQLVASGCT